jgi:hypothetical protein
MAAVPDLVHPELGRGDHTLYNFVKFVAEAGQAMNSKYPGGSPPRDLGD